MLNIKILHYEIHFLKVPPKQSFAQNPNIFLFAVLY